MMSSSRGRIVMWCTVAAILGIFAYSFFINLN